AGLCSALVSFVLCSIVFFAINAVMIDARLSCYSLISEQQIEYAPTLSEAQLCPEGKSGAQMAGFEKAYAHVSVTTPGVYLSKGARIAGLLLAFCVAFAVFFSKALRPSVFHAARALVARISPLQAFGMLGVGVLAYLKP